MGMLFGKKEMNKTIWTTVKDACHFAQACHKFGSPALGSTGAAGSAYTLYILIILELMTQ
jgi:hypothetical protein